MQARSFFAGKVEIKTLLVTDQPATRPEVRARLISPKGEMAVLADTGQVIRHLSYVELRPGQRRGDHYHKLRREYFYLISGETSLVLEETTSGSRMAAKISAGDLIYIQPGIAHAFAPLTAGHGVEFAAEPFDLSDVYPHLVSA